MCVCVCVFEYACVRGSERVLLPAQLSTLTGLLGGMMGGSQFRPGTIQDRECMLVLTAWTS